MADGGQNLGPIVREDKVNPSCCIEVIEKRHKRFSRNTASFIRVPRENRVQHILIMGDQRSAWFLLIRQYLAQVSECLWDRYWMMYR